MQKYHSYEDVGERRKAERQGLAGGRCFDPEGRKGVPRERAMNSARPSRNSNVCQAPSIHTNGFSTVKNRESLTVFSGGCGIK